ncbi:MAG: hypothetical protein EXS55_03655 [Candidatus Magasanikbacteria bacterium]|nr:hypothetical protein [Candidatus Magasanikbacteria bacterium]
MRIFVALVGAVIAVVGFFLAQQRQLPAPASLTELATLPVVSSVASTPAVTSSIKKISAGIRYEFISRVVDGDTVQLESGEKVRYIGINAPESVDPRRSVQCFGKEASERNKQLVEGKFVRLVKDVSPTDKYGRLLRYVYLEDGTFVNLKLVEDGYALASTFPPDVKFSKLFVSAARQAREAGRGLWSACR